jgi:hypothetical protein
VYEYIWYICIYVHDVGTAILEYITTEGGLTFLRGEGGDEGSYLCINDEGFVFVIILLMVSYMHLYIFMYIYT